MLRRTCALVSIAFSLFLFSATGAATTAQRTFVASTGNDANPCSIAAPCRGFARAITQTSAGGEVIVLDSAGYGACDGHEIGIDHRSGRHLRRDQRVQRQWRHGERAGRDRRAARLVDQRPGRQQWHLLQAAARLRVENCVVSAMHVAGISHTATAPDAELIVLDTIVRDNGGRGIYLFANVGSLVLDHVRSEHNGGNGVSLTPSVGSLGALATITDSVFTHNEGDGIGADSVAGATITLVVDRSVMSNNGQNGFRAAASAGSGVATVSRSAINDNGGDGISIGEGAEVAASENVVHRNSGSGVHVSSTAPSGFSTLSGNTFHGNLSGAIRASGPGTVVAASANTAFNAYSECDNGALLYTYGNNVTAGIASIGCTISSVGLY